MNEERINTLIDELIETARVSDRESFISLLGTLTATLIDTNYPAVPRLLKQWKDTGDGMVTVDFKIKDGKPTQAVYHQMIKLEF